MSFARSTAPTPTVETPAAPRVASSNMTAEVLWAECVRLSAASRRLRMIVEDTKLVSFDQGRATIRVSGLARSAAPELGDLFTRAAGMSVSLVIDTDSVPQSQPTTELKRDVSSPAAATPEGAAPPDDLRQHPLVRQAEELFGARVVRVDAARPS